MFDFHLICVQFDKRTGAAMYHILFITRTNGQGYFKNVSVHVQGFFAPLLASLEFIQLIDKDSSTVHGIKQGP